jgi:hypothetical protein
VDGTSRAVAASLVFSFNLPFGLPRQNRSTNRNTIARLSSTGESIESNAARSTLELQMLNAILGALKWGAVGFVVCLFLMMMFEASRIHDDIPVPEFKRRHTKRTAVVLSTFAGILSGLVWLLVQHWD